MNSFGDYLKNKGDDNFQKNIKGDDNYQSNIKASNKEALENFVSKKPKNGDMAYSQYHGKVYVGMLAFNDENGPTRLMTIGEEYARNSCPHLMGAKGYRMPGFLLFPPIANVKNPGGLPSLSIGYEGPVVWDAKKGMFYAQPDSD